MDRVELVFWIGLAGALAIGIASERHRQRWVRRLIETGRIQAKPDLHTRVTEPMLSMLFRRDPDPATDEVRSRAMRWVIALLGYGAVVSILMVRAAS